MNAQIKSEISALVEASRDAIACSVDALGSPCAKSMFKAKNEGIKTIWFSSNMSAERTQQWMKNSAACLYFPDPAHIHGLMLSGRMKVCTDDETKLAFWKEGDEQYYPLGPTDPDYCILCFSAQSGNYWSNGKYTFSVGELQEA